MKYLLAIYKLLSLLLRESLFLHAASSCCTSNSICIFRIKVYVLLILGTAIYLIYIVAASILRWCTRSACFVNTFRRAAISSGVVAEVQFLMWHQILTGWILLNLGSICHSWISSVTVASWSLLFSALKQSIMCRSCIHGVHLWAGLRQHRGLLCAGELGGLKISIIWV